MRRASLTVLLAVHLFGCLIGCSGDEALDERVPAEPGGRLEVDLDRGLGLRPDPGTLVVQTHDVNEVRIVADASEWGASSVHFRVDRGGDTVRVLGRVGGALSWMFGGPRIEVRIWVPRETAIDVRSSGGGVRIEDVIGDVRARSDDGPIEIIRAEGEVRVRTSGDVRLVEVDGNVDVRLEEGDIDATRIRGNVALRTGAGEIEVDHLDGELVARSDRGGIEVRELSGSLEAITERGSVFVSFEGPPAGRLETARGSVEVSMPRSAGAELEAVSSGGRVALGPGLSVPGTQAEDRVEGRINGGGEALRLFTANGDVNVRPR